PGRRPTAGWSPEADRHRRGASDPVGDRACRAGPQRGFPRWKDRNRDDVVRGAWASGGVPARVGGWGYPLLHSVRRTDSSGTGPAWWPARSGRARPEDVADAPDGHEQARAPRVLFEQPPQPAHVHVDRAPAPPRVVLPAPDLA